MDRISDFGSDDEGSNPSAATNLKQKTAPNSQAVNYIFEKFGNAYFSDVTIDFVEENFKIKQALNHRTSDTKNLKYQEFLEKLNERIAEQQRKVKHKIFV